MSGARSLSFRDLCQAHRAHAFECEIPTGNDDEVYCVCGAALRRLRSGALRPLELFHLVALHGLEPGGYVGARIKAYHRYHSSGRPEHTTWRNALVRTIGPRLPSSDSLCETAGGALDWAAFQWAYDLVPDDATSIIAGIPVDALLPEITSRIATGVPEHAECCYYKIIAFHGDERCAAWIRSRWSVVLPSRIADLVRASARCLDSTERVDRFLAAVAQVPPGERDKQWLAMGRLAEGLDSDSAFSAATRFFDLLLKRDFARSALYVLSNLAKKGHLRERILHWIEDHAFDHSLVDQAEMQPHPVRTITTVPMFEAFGQLASVCDITWQRIASWLGRGKPLSHVAIDALMTCGALNADQISGAVLHMPRPLRAPSDTDSMSRVLRAFAKQEPDPAIRHKLALIVSNWPLVLAGFPVKSGPSVTDVVKNVDAALGVAPLE